MEWSEVFDYYFIIENSPSRALVFIPGSHTGGHIEYAWTTVEDIHNGLDYSLLSNTTYSLMGDERLRPGNTFKNYHEIIKLSKEERICLKIKKMDERWGRYQANKKKPTLRSKLLPDDHQPIPRTATEVRARQNASVHYNW